MGHLLFLQPQSDQALRRVFYAGPAGSPENKTDVTAGKARQRIMPGSPEVGDEPGIISLIQKGCALLTAHSTPTLTV
jgi:hypothetical protein